jgi:2,4-didehydro-3-deoxy-L-rhamnonate hydrolase
MAQGKSADTFAPLAPFLATPDEVPNPGDLHMWLKVNGEDRQQGDHGNMIFDVPFRVSYVSQLLTLLPADVISTGTPSGVAFGMHPPAISSRVTSPISESKGWAVRDQR